MGDSSRRDPDGTGFSGKPVMATTVGVGIASVSIDPLQLAMARMMGMAPEGVDLDELDSTPQLKLGIILDSGSGHTLLYHFDMDDAVDWCTEMGRYGVAIQAYLDGDPNPLQALCNECTHQADGNGNATHGEKINVAAHMHKGVLQ